MKKSLTTKRLLYQIVHKSLIQLVIIAAFSGLALAGPVSGQGILDKKVSIEFSNLSLGKALYQVQRSAKVKFSYNSRTLPLNVPVSVSAHEKPLSLVLEQLLKPLNINYKRVGNQVVLRNDDGAQKEISLPEIKPLVESGPQLVADVPIGGRVTDDKGEVLPGVSILVKGTQIGTVTNASGNYSLSVPSGSITLVFSYIGYVTQEIELGTRKNVDVVLQGDTQSLDEVVVVAFGKQRKESVIGAVTTLSASDLKVPVSKLSNSLAGQLAGIVAVQGTGEPGAGSGFWIRGISTFGANNSPLILVDGIERPLDLVDPEDIESFSILKDATATAVYGVRGANGIVLITTKKGKNTGKPTINTRIERGLLSPVRVAKLANAGQWIDYYNDISFEATGSKAFPDHLKQKYLDGSDPDLYPNVDWMKTIFKESTTSSRANLNVSGGGKMARYYVSGSYYTENGIFNPTETKQYNPSVNYSKLNFRSNLDIDISPSTELSLNLSNQYETKNRLGVDMADMYARVMTTPPISIPAIYSDGTLAMPLVGQNPYYSLNSTGMSQDFWNTAQSLISLTQDMSDFLLRGLRANVKFSWDAFNGSTLDKRKNPSNYYATGRDEAGNLIFHRNSDGSDYLSLVRSNRGSRTTNLEASLTYENIFNSRHRVGGLFLFAMREHTDNFPGTYIEAFPYRNIGVAARGTYSYMDRYFIEGNFGYNGSENFAPGKRFGFFPSVAVGYIISNEDYFKDLSTKINLLKVRASYGEIGNDKIGGNRRFAYNTEMMWTGGYTFGTTGQGGKSGIATGHPGNPNVAWESALKSNIGLELGLFNKAKLITDYFFERRNGIYILQESVPSVVGINVAQYVNLGRMKNQGIDASLEYTETLNDFLIQGRANFTFNRNKKLYDDRPTPVWAYQAEAGTPFLQQRGLVALGLFESEEDIANSPTQLFGDVRPGDIKYKDINGDGAVDTYDMVPIGRTHIPEMTYGFGVSMKYKGFDLSGFFQGVGNVTRIIGAEPIFGPSGNILVAGQLFSEVADMRWTPRNPDPNARYPRMSLAYNENNRHASTYYQRNMSYLRLKNAEIGYTLPKRLVQKARFSTVRFYIQTVNLFTFSKFKMWDPELDTNYGAIYPQMKVVNFGLNINI